MARLRAHLALPLAAPVAVGMALRCVGLARQVVGDDELHAVRAALAMPVGEILSTYRVTDHSLPLTALYRLALDAGVPLSELALRAPPLAGSLALLALAPALAAPLVGRRVAVVWAWLLAVLPMLVAYGSMVRSYALVLPAATLALVCFARFWSAEGARFAAGFAALGALAIWLHLGAGPFALGPLAFGAASALRAPRGRDETGRVRAGDAGGPRRLAHVGASALGLALAGGALLAPAAGSLAELVARKRGAPGATLAIALEVAQLHAGVAGPGALVVGALAVLGAAIGWRRGGGARALVGCAVGGIAAQLVGLAVLAPKLDSPVVAARAWLVALPAAALCVALGVEAVAARTRRPVLVAAAAIAALVAAGPLPDAGRWRSAFRHHDDYLLFTRSRARLAPPALPRFYAELASGARERGAVVEAPWHPFWGFGHAVPAYQEVHGEDVIVANDEDYARTDTFAWRNAVALAPAPVLRTRARWLVLHLDLEREETALRAARGAAAPARAHGEVWRVLRARAARARRDLERAYGPPDARGGGLVVWDLARVRASGASAGSTAAR